MKNVIGICGALVIITTGICIAHNIDPDGGCAWGFLQAYPPQNYPPKVLAAPPTYQLDEDDLEDVAADDNDWFMWTEPAAKFWDFLIVTFDIDAFLGTPTDIDMNWRVGVDHDTNETFLFYWNAETPGWVLLEDNGQCGRNPPLMDTDVWEAWENKGDMDHLLFMFVGATPAPGDDYIKCNVADLDVAY